MFVILPCVLLYYLCFYIFFFFKQKTAYEMRISDWSSDVCSSDLPVLRGRLNIHLEGLAAAVTFKRGPDHGNAHERNSCLCRNAISLASCIESGGSHSHMRRCCSSAASASDRKSPSLNYSH